MNKGIANFIVKFLSTKNRNLFAVQLGSALILTNFGIVGIPASILGYLLKGILGVLIEDGTFLIDITLDSLKEGTKRDEFKVTATDAYVRATAKIYDEAKKEEIRKQYLEIIAKIGAVGDGPK